jgi:hypothetical protein
VGLAYTGLDEGFGGGPHLPAILSRNPLTTNDRGMPDPEAAVASRRLERYAAISVVAGGRTGLFPKWAVIQA